MAHPPGRAIALRDAPAMRHAPLRPAPGGCSSPEQCTVAEQRVTLLGQGPPGVLTYLCFAGISQRSERGAFFLQVARRMDKGRPGPTGAAGRDKLAPLGNTLCCPQTCCSFIRVVRWLGQCPPWLASCRGSALSPPPPRATLIANVGQREGSEVPAKQAQSWCSGECGEQPEELLQHQLYQNFILC